MLGACACATSGACACMYGAHVHVRMVRACMVHVCVQASASAYLVLCVTRMAQVQRLCMPAQRLALASRCALLAMLAGALRTRQPAWLRTRQQAWQAVRINLPCAVPCMPRTPRTPHG